MTRRHGLGLLVAFAACFAVSALGGLFTASSVSSWYLDLTRPAWNPPGWLFGPVWLTLYAMMAVAVWDVWRCAKDTRRAVALFACQLTLNLGWSVLFFGLRRPDLALIEIVVLLVFIIATTLAFARHRRRAALLMVPYALWTSFATVLNFAIWRLN